MSDTEYPQHIALAFDQPRFLLPELDVGQAEIARAQTPAAPVLAALYRYQGVIYWRARGCPWLVATMEHLCQLLAAGMSTEDVLQALNDWELPPVKRYCLVMARELLQSLPRHAPGVEAC